MYKVFIDGKEGTTGLRIYDRLEKRNDIELLTISEELRKDPTAKKELINSSDITFLCLPDAAAIESVGLVENPNVKIIDASTAHRTNPGWSYGFPELSLEHFNSIKNGTRIAVPGCHASGFISLVYPLVAAGKLLPDYPLVCYSLTGYSGGGKKMIAEYESPEKREELFSPRQYGLTQNHKHLREMKAIAGLDFEPIFAPIVDDFYSGMLVSVPLYSHMLPGNPSMQDILDIFAAAYDGKPLIKVLPLGGGDSVGAYMGSNNLAGKDTMEIVVAGNDDRILLMSRFDNLGKGASGAAIQCMNIALGLDETLGLEL